MAAKGHEKAAGLAEITKAGCLFSER